MALPKLPILDHNKSIFDMTRNELAEWAKTTPANQNGYEIDPKDAKKLARKIVNEGITGPQLSNLGQDGIRDLFPPGWKPEVVAKFAKTVQKIKEDEVIQNTQNKKGGLLSAIPNQFKVNVAGIGRGNKSIEVNKTWTFQRFKEALYEGELGHLPTDTQRRKEVLKNLNLVGTKMPPANQHNKTLEALNWRPGEAIHATYTTTFKRKINQKRNENINQYVADKKSKHESQNNDDVKVQAENAINNLIAFDKHQMSIFEMTTNELAEWTKTLPSYQANCEIDPKDAKKLAKKIIRKNITGPQLSNLGGDGIRNLFPPGWKPEVVAKFAKTVAKVKEYEIIQNTQNQNGGLNLEIPNQFRVNVGGIGIRNKGIEVEKTWTFQRFKEALYESEIGQLPTDPQQRRNRLKNFNLVGTKMPLANEYNKTLEELGWRPGEAIHILRS